MSFRRAGQRPELAGVAVLGGWRWGRFGRRGSAGCGDYGVPAVEKLGDEFKADTSGGADYEPGLPHYQGSKVIKEA